MGFVTVLDDKRVAKWVMERTPYPQRKGFDAQPDYPIRGIGYEVDGKMVMGLIFMNHAPWLKNIEVGIALEGSGGVLRGILRHAMIYPFVQLGCQRVTAYVPKRADKSRKMVQAVGFVEEGNMRHGFGTDDCMVYGLLKREAERKWRFEELLQNSALQA